MNDFFNRSQPTLPTSDELLQLGQEVMQFLTRHAGLGYNFDEYTNNHAWILYRAGSDLLEGRVPRMASVCSSWFSNAYAPYSSSQAREWHDRLVSRINQLINLALECSNQQ
jgi:hypothetical protein